VLKTASSNDDEPSRLKQISKPGPFCATAHMHTDDKSVYVLTSSCEFNPHEMIKL